ncbi:MAG: glycosyltransferase [Myxococcales bacterium]|nr:glycosyltransferase [Myxococcales bacterium]MDD9967053.1 glycosyltransferase [Myxococcales bacterium]
MKISAVLMAHNEEQLIGQALRSLGTVADELIVGHDGPCRDRTLEIARELADQVHEFEFRGAPEVNTIKLLRCVKHDWVIRIDCDETLSENLVEAILRLKQTGPPEGVTHYNCFWVNMTAQEGSEPPTHAESDEANRLLLFKRSETTWVGIPHRVPEVGGGAAELREGLLHWAPHQSYSTYDLVTKKLLPFAERDAKIRVRYPLETYGFDPTSDPQAHILGRDRLRHDHPLLSAVPLATLSLSRSFLGAFRARSLKEFRSNLRWPVAHGVYQLALGYNIARERRRAATSRSEQQSFQAS